MALLTSQATTGAGAALTFATCAGGGDTFEISGKERLLIKNGSGSPITVTLTAQAADEFGETHDVDYVVAASATFITPQLSRRRFADASGIAHIAYSGVTTLTIAVVGSAV